MNIYDFVQTKETDYIKGVTLEDGWDWSMKDHLRRSFLYKHSQFEDENENRTLRPFKNIVRPILNIQYRTEGFDVKDIELYVNNSDIYHKSFLIKKYHEKWALENEIDTFIDEMVESYVDYGGALIKNVGKKRPEVVDLRTIAFCDQTGILDAPFCIKHSFTPTELRKQEQWGQDSNGATHSIEDLIVLAKDEDEIEIYELHGQLDDEITEEDGDNEIAIIAFYRDSQDVEQGVTLFRTREPKLPFKMLKRDDIPGRALGWGGVEELFEPQIWTNWAEIQLTEMLNQASKVLYKSSDPSFKTRNNLTNTPQGEVFTVQEGRDITQLDTFPRNAPTFNEFLERLEKHANTIGAASEALQGEAPTSGTPFKLYEAQIIENKGMHKYRQGKIATFTEEVWREWVLPHLSREIVKGDKFLIELSGDEMMEVAEKVVTNAVAKRMKEQILNAQIPDILEMEELKAKIRSDFVKSPKKFIEILKDEFKGEDIGIMTNIVDKQKRMALLTDKIVSFVRQVLATPDMRQDSEVIKMTNEILEFSGMSPLRYGLNPQQAQVQAPQQGGGGTEPLKALGQSQNEQSQNR